MKLSIIIPVYNEEKTILSVLTKLLKVKLPCEKEIIIINDGSTDDTASEIKKVIKTPRTVTRRGSSEVEEFDKHILKVINHKKNQGKGAAVKSGIKVATGDYILIQDADLEYDPKEIPNLLSVILACPESVSDPGRSASGRIARMTKSVAVYGSRFMDKRAVIPLLYYLGNKFLTMLMNLLYGTRLTDMETGYKLLPGKFMKRLNLRNISFDIEPEITARLIRSNIKIVEVPISYHGRTHMAGKKLTVKDAFGAIYTILHLRFF